MTIRTYKNGKLFSEVGISFFSLGKKFFRYTHQYGNLSIRVPHGRWEYLGRFMSISNAVVWLTIGEHAKCDYPYAKYEGGKLYATYITGESAGSAEIIGVEVVRKNKNRELPVLGSEDNRKDKESKSGGKKKGGKAIQKFGDYLFRRFVQVL